MGRRKRKRRAAAVAQAAQQKNKGGGGVPCLRKGCDGILILIDPHGDKIRVKCAKCARVYYLKMSIFQFIKLGQKNFFQ